MNKKEKADLRRIGSTEKQATVTSTRFSCFDYSRAQRINQSGLRFGCWAFRTVNITRGRFESYQPFSQIGGVA